MDIRYQIQQIRRGGLPVPLRKSFRLPAYFAKLLYRGPAYLIAVPLVMLIRLLRPFVLVRIGRLVSTRIGHFAGNTEMYCCEQDDGINNPSARHIDLFYVVNPVCNDQLLKMWQRVLRIYPGWLLLPVQRVNKLLPGGEAHHLEPSSQSDRDIHNLLDKYPCHIGFTYDEMSRGQAGLRAMGIPEGSKFVCLTVRDSAYLAMAFSRGDWGYHNYRDADIDNYVVAAEALAERGYYVIRMGAAVYKPLKSSHPRVIDYAFNGMRNDFMDIWLGAHCAFCISLGTGFDAVPVIFRRLVAFVNFVPVGIFATFRKEFLGIIKHHDYINGDREMTLSEIVNSGAHVALSTSEYYEKGISLRENTPEEIRDLVLEMADRIDGTWSVQQADEELQARFWQLFPSDAKSGNGVPLHGDIRAKFGAVFLRNNPQWLQ